VFTGHEFGFPFQAFLVVGMAALFVSELGGVYAASAAGLGFGIEDVVQHLVKDYELYEELGHMRIIEGGMNSHEGVAAIVAAENDVAAASVGRLDSAAAPGDVDLKLAVEKLAVDVIGESVKIVNAASGPEDERARGSGFLFVILRVIVHILTKDGLATGRGPGDILPESFYYIIGCGKKHFVDAETGR